MTKSQNTEYIKWIAIEIINKNFGQKTAQIYSQYFVSKADEDIINSVRELLTEYLGPAYATELVESAFSNSSK